MLLAVLAGSGAARAAPAADAFGCPPEVAAYGVGDFTDARHERWYHRFWTGACTDLPVFTCVSGRPFWADTMTKILAKVPAVEHDALVIRLCILGRRVGHEWAKENDIRTIDTKAVIDWTRRLEAAADPEPVLDAIGREVDARLAPR